jgi:hypothetical protein
MSRFSSTNFYEPQFRTIPNSGAHGEYSNQCIWISISWYLNKILGLNVSLEEIRNIIQKKGLKINGTKDMFDSNEHEDGLDYVCELYNIQLRTYRMCDLTGNISEDRMMINGNKKPQAYILYLCCTGSHFEPIWKINSNLLYGEDFSNIINDKVSEKVPVEKVPVEKVPVEKVSEDSTIQQALMESISTECVRLESVNMEYESIITDCKSKLENFEEHIKSCACLSYDEQVQNVITIQEAMFKEQIKIDQTNQKLNKAIHDLNEAKTQLFLLENKY